MRTITRMIEDEVYEAKNEAGQLVTIDMRASETKKNQSPTELLLSALSGCSAVDIVAILKKRKKTIQSFTIETTGTRRDEQPRSFTKILCKFIVTSPDVTEDELHKAAKLSVEKYCSVASSLRSEISISVEVLRN